MIDTALSQESARVVLRPNQSWTWRANQYFLLVLCCVSLAIGISFALGGFWMVLPFTLLELLFLFGCLWYCVRRGYRQQVITLYPDRVHVEFGHFASSAKRTLVRHFDRFYTRFHVQQPTHPWKDKAVYVRCRGEQLRIGGFLNADDVNLLVRELRQCVRHVDSLGTP